MNEAAAFLTARADVLAALLARDWQGALVGGITDRPAVEACFAAGEGAILSLKIGGSLDPKSPSVTVEAEVVTLDDPGAADQRQAVIAIGGITAPCVRMISMALIFGFSKLWMNSMLRASSATVVANSRTSAVIGPTAAMMS